MTIKEEVAEVEKERGRGGIGSEEEKGVRTIKGRSRERGKGV